MFLGDCDSFVNDVYKIMSKFACFNKNEIKSFAYMHCAAYTGFIMGLFGKQIPDKYTRYFFKKSGQFTCMKYGLNFKELMDDPYSIDYQWIPSDCPFDIDEYIEEIDGNPVNLSQLIFISFCFNPGLILLSNYKNGLPKKMDKALREECLDFLTEGMSPLLNVFDRLNSILRKKLL